MSKIEIKKIGITKLDTDAIVNAANEELKEIVGDEKIEDSVIWWCRKYSVFFHVIFEDEDLNRFFQEFNVYNPPQGHQGKYKILDECFHEAYDCNVVIKDYGQIVEDGNLSDRDISRPTKEWTASLTVKQILGAIAWHFRRDHFCEGSWISDSVANGHMMVLVDQLLERIC